MKTELGEKLLDEMYKGHQFNGKFSSDGETIVFPLNHTIDTRALKQLVIGKGLRYYFRVNFNSIDLVVF